MIASLSLFAALLAVPHSPAISLDINTKDGDKISGDYTFRITVQSEKPVSQVEFYVGDDLRSSDTSTPYEFSLDTLAEKEGSLKVTFAAYTTDNESAKKSITVNVDNALGLGAEAHVQKAKDLLSISKWDEAIQEGRIALKTKPGFNPARLVMARGYLGKGVLDSAQRYAEDALASEGGSKDASELLTVINLQRAFNTFHRGTGDPSETLQTVASALKSAVEMRRKNLDDSIDAMSPSKANMLSYADAALRASRYSAANNALMSAFRSDSANPALANRIAYAQIRNARFLDAKLSLAESVRKQSLDAYGNALMAIIEYHLGNQQASDDAMREAILSDNEDMGVRTAQVYLAVVRGKRDVVGKLVRDLALESSMKSEVQYYLTQVYSWSGDWAAAQKSFERTVMTEPTNYDAFVQRANESLEIAISSRTAPEQSKYNFQVCRVFLETALKAKPDSGEALTGLALASMQQKDNANAIKFAEAAASAMPSYAAARYTYSMMASQRQQDMKAAIEAIRRQNRDGSLSDDQRSQMAKLSTESDRMGVIAMNEMKAAGGLDKAQLDGRNIPTLADAQRYFVKYGRVPLITAPK